MHEPLITRRQLAEFLRARGYPISLSTLNKLAMAAVNAGPPVACWWGARALYNPAAALAWAEARTTRQRGQGWRIEADWWGEPPDEPPEALLGKWREEAERFNADEWPDDRVQAEIERYERDSGANQAGGSA